MSTTLVPGKAYTTAVTQCKTKDVAQCAVPGASLFDIQSNDPRITLVAGGYPLFHEGKIVGRIGVGGGSEEQDCEFDQNLTEAVTKLMKSLNQIDFLPFIGRHLKREIIFNLIGGSSGKEFLQSIPQFTRDYRKMFGNSPKNDMQLLRSQLKTLKKEWLISI